MNFVVFAEIPEITVFTVFTSFGKVSKSGNFPKYQGLIFGGPGGVRGTRISRSPTRPRWIDQSVACTRITRKPVYQERGIPGFWARGGGWLQRIAPRAPRGIREIPEFPEFPEFEDLAVLSTTPLDLKIQLGGMKSMISTRIIAERLFAVMSLWILWCES